MVTVNVNETEIEIEENSTILQLLNQINTSSNGIAVAINNHIIPGNTWESQLVNQNDNILIIKATQGG
ncbi:sulfur carrier protein ThiS [Marinigracilibium pacificum]|uniref:Sulfur carrier protein ThiS n=1 Tax=Marinigracilibium pacificum TaxID=2729599 RepID=A0A848IWS0_9BACT|nr:sulfur carrier protein ThiS [Marinigracilibium pacificum]NMM47725.1 sulfur carrier protein ThiS [Marinigracilibium pacificum]